MYIHKKVHQVSGIFLLIVLCMHCRTYPGSGWTTGVGFVTGAVVGVGATWGFMHIKTTADKDSQQKKALEALQRYKQTYATELQWKSNGSISKEAVLTQVAQRCSHISPYRHLAYSQTLDVVIQECREHQKSFEPSSSVWQDFHYCIEHLLYAQQVNSGLCANEIHAEQYQKQEDLMHQEEHKVRMDKERADIVLKQSAAEEHQQKIIWLSKKNNSLDGLARSISDLNHSLKIFNHIHATH